MGWYLGDVFYHYSVGRLSLIYRIERLLRRIQHSEPLNDSLRENLHFTTEYRLTVLWHPYIHPIFAELFDPLGLVSTAFLDHQYVFENVLPEKLMKLTN